MNDASFTDATFAAPAASFAACDSALDDVCAVCTLRADCRYVLRVACACAKGVTRHALICSWQGEGRCG
eukprot:284913-Pleurochrysis_carterae.AAC.1